jgi:hypothetical protein
MANRTGTYVAFDALGEVDPTKSDFRYYSTVEAWAANKHMDFTYVNSHDKTCAVRDTSLRATLEARIQERLRASKNIIVILSPDTRKSGSMLSYEIEQAVDTYKIPLIVAYTRYRVVLHPELLSSYWPNAVASRIGNALVDAIHIPFKQRALLDAIETRTVAKMDEPNYVKGALVRFTEKWHRDAGLLYPLESAANITSYPC